MLSVSFICNRTGVTSEAQTVNPSGEPDFTPCFSGVGIAQYLVFYVVFFRLFCVLFTMVLSVLLRYTASDFGILKPFFRQKGVPTYTKGCAKIYKRVCQNIQKDVPKYTAHRFKKIRIYLHYRHPLIDVDFFLSVFCYLQMQFMFNFQMFWKFWRNKSVLMYCTFNSGVNSRVGSLVLGDNNTRTSIVDIRVLSTILV